MTTDEMTQDMNARYAEAIAGLRATVDALTRDEKNIEQIIIKTWNSLDTLANTRAMDRAGVFAVGVATGIESMGRAIIEVLESLAD